MTSYVDEIEQQTKDNENFRKVLFTGQHLQLVLMSLQPGEDIGLETHATTDQFFRFEAGTGVVIIDGQEHSVQDGDVVIVPAGAEHNVKNTSSDTALKMYTLYAPPHHRDGVVHATKAEAEADETDHL